MLNTPGSLSTAGYEKITSFDASDPETAVVQFSEPYAAYKNLFSGASGGIIKKDAVANCDDVSGDLQDSVPFSGRPWKQESWSKDQTVLVPNDKYWVPEDIPKAKRVVMVPKADSDTEINSLKSGEVGMIFPQAFAGITDALNDPNIKFTPGYGTNYEGLYFQQRNGPFKDPIFRKAFSMSVDRDLILKTIYNPIFPGSKLLQCGLWVPTVGKWCDDTQFENSYDPAAAEKLLTDNGWKKGSDGFWADASGNVPSLRWMVNTGNKRREDTQALMIPDFAAKGFKVVADNSDADTVFQKRLPALDYDLAMYIQTASPDPTVTGIMSCDKIPSAANNNQGQNQTGYCNEEASKLMVESDHTIDETRASRSDPQDRPVPRRRLGHAAVVPVPEHRRLADRQGRRPGRRVRRELHERLQEPQQVGAGWRHRHHDRRRAVAGLHQPRHGVRQLLVDGVDRSVPDPSVRVGHHR